MNIFDFRNQLVKHYSDYVESFITIQDLRIREEVDRQISLGLLWPDVLIQLNPNFEPGKYISELVEEGVLHEECGKIFRVGKSKSDPVGKDLRLHKHQEEAIRCANPETGFPTFAFRLHQFISRGGSVYATLEPEAKRYITVFGQTYVPGGPV